MTFLVALTNRQSGATVNVILQRDIARSIDLIGFHSGHAHQRIAAHARGDIVPVAHGYWFLSVNGQ